MDPESRLALLLTRHGGVTDAWIREALAASGATPRQAALLMTLDGGQVGQRDLGALLRTDPSVLVNLLNTLEDRDLVRRRRDPADRRRHIVEITEAGTAAASKLDAAIGCVEGELFADLTPQERETLRSLLARVRTTRDGTCDSSPTTDCRIRARARGAERFTLGAPFLQAMWRSAEGTRARPLLQEWGTLSPSRSDRTAVEAFPALSYR